jgi:hypothetical protein
VTPDGRGEYHCARAADTPRSLPAVGAPSRPDREYRISIQKAGTAVGSRGRLFVCRLLAHVPNHLDELGLGIGVVVNDLPLAVLLPVNVGRPALQGDLITRYFHRRGLGTEFVREVASDADELIPTQRVSAVYISMIAEAFL